MKLGSNSCCRSRDGLVTAARPTARAPPSRPCRGQSALLAATDDIVAFATIHVPLVHPVFAAKSIVTADHVGSGRFGINIVSGWNVEEFAMFGIPLREHDERYAYSAEWVTILNKIYAETAPFDFDGKYFNLRNVEGKPKPWGNGRPLLMSAGSSPAGRAFAANYTDCLFMVITEDGNIASDVAQVRAVPGADKCGLYASGHLLCRRTAKETEEYYHYLVREKGDWEAAEQIIVKRAAGGSQSLSPEIMRRMKERVIAGGATFPVIGSYDGVAQKFLRLSEAGLDGMAVILVNYVQEMPILRDEVLPRLEQLKLRAGHNRSETTEMNALRDKYAIVGTGKSRLGQVGLNSLALLEEAIKAALDDAGLTQ